MKNVPKIVWSILACLLCIVATAAACLLLADKGASSDKYLEMISIIRSNFYEERDVAYLEDASAGAMIDSLGDGWSHYMNAQEYADYKLTSANQYVGIGVTTAYSENYGYLAVTSVTPGSPADLAHIKVGNMIAAVNNTDVSTFTPDELRSYFQTFGEDTFTVHLFNSQGGKATATMKCELIFTEPVYYRVIDKTTVGYIKITNFDDRSAASLKAALTGLAELNVTSLIIDVRDNSSGKAAELAEALDMLLPRGDMFLMVDQKSRETTYSSNASCVELPIVVIINEHTACAAEMFAQTLQSIGGATVVGKQTTGNSQSQTVVELSDGSAVLISKYLYLTPDKKSLAELGGVVPNVPSYMIEDSTMDVQLEAAVDAAS